MTISIGALIEARSKMTPGIYYAWGTTIMAHEPSPDRCDDPALVGCATAGDAAGIVATHSAADVLIEIARTAKVLQAAQVVSAAARAAFAEAARALVNADAFEALADEVDEANAQEFRLRALRDAALAKVTL